MLAVSDIPPFMSPSRAPLAVSDLAAGPALAAGARPRGLHDGVLGRVFVPVLAVRDGRTTSPDVLGVGDWLQVERVDTGGIPAQMVKFQSVWDGSHAQRVGDAMGSDPTTFGGPEDVSVPDHALATRPQMARVRSPRLIDAAPELLFRGHHRATDHRVSVLAPAPVVHGTQVVAIHGPVASIDAALPGTLPHLNTFPRGGGRAPGRSCVAGVLRVRCYRKGGTGP